MGAQGTDVALASADIVLMTSDLRRLGTCLRLSCRCRRTIHVNVAIGLVWTIVLVGLAGTWHAGRAGCHHRRCLPQPEHPDRDPERRTAAAF